MLKKTPLALFSFAAIIILTLGSGTVLRAHGSTTIVLKTPLTPVFYDKIEKSFTEMPFSGRDRHRHTLLDVAVKMDKGKQSEWSCSKRAGLREITTTLYNIHTREAVPIFKGRIPPDSVFDEFFRCRGFGVQKKIHPRLIEALLKAADNFDAPRAEIISAYRSEKFNDSLAKKGRGVADESRHTRGEAVDFTLPGIPAKSLGAWLRTHFSGGVGTYPRDNFVHIDVGPRRSWTG